MKKNENLAYCFSQEEDCWKDTMSSNDINILGFVSIHEYNTKLEVVHFHLNT